MEDILESSFEARASFGRKLVIFMASVKHKDTARKKKTKRFCKLARVFTNQLLVKVKHLTEYDP